MSAENWLFSVGSMLSTCNKVVQYSWKSSSKLQKTDNWDERSESLPSLQRCNFVCMYVCMYVSIRHGPAQ